MDRRLVQRALMRPTGRHATQVTQSSGGRANVRAIGPPASSAALAATGGAEGHGDFDSVYDAHFAFVWRSLRALGVGCEALDDAAQDVFGTVARRLAGFEGRSSLRTWLFGIAQNVAANHRRWHARKGNRWEPLSDGASERIASGEPTPQAHAEHKEAADFVVQFSAELEEPQRAVFVLGLLEGVPATEIASLLGVPVNTVYSRMHTLRRELKSRMARREVEK